MTSKLLVFICLVILCVPVIVFGQGGGADGGGAAAAPEFLPLVGIPGVTDAGNAGFGDYINALYRLSISLAALLAVVKIVAAGAKYMLSDIVTSKESAKSDIRGALLGLLIILGAFIILNTINTDITDNEFVIEDLKGADSSESRILRAQGRFSANLAACEADPSCSILTSISDISAECAARSGTYVQGSAVGYALGSGAYRNYCFYDADKFAETEELGGTVGDTVTTENIVGVKNVPTTAIESALGLGTGEVGDTELGYIASYLSGGITNTDLQDTLGSDINLTAIDTIKRELNCGTNNTVGYTKETSSVGANIKFQCINTNP